MDDLEQLEDLVEWLEGVTVGSPGKGAMHGFEADVLGAMRGTEEWHRPGLRPWYALTEVRDAFEDLIEILPAVQDANVYGRPGRIAARDTEIRDRCDAILWRLDDASQEALYMACNLLGFHRKANRQRPALDAVLRRRGWRPSRWGWRPDR